MLAGADIKAYNVEMAHPVSNGTDAVSKQNGIRTVV